MPAPLLHLLVTRARVGIFKPRYPVDLASTILLSAFVATSEPRGFKSTAKFSEWLDSMQEEIDALHAIICGTWYLDPCELTLFARNGFSALSFMLMGLLSVTKLDSLLKVSLRF